MSARGFAACVGLGALLTAASAQAQSVALSAVVTRNVAARDSSYHPTWINHADCVANAQLTFTVQMTAWQGYALEVWASASADCSDPSQRTGASPYCWNVFSEQPTAGSSYPVRLLAQDIVGQHLNTHPGHGPGSGTVADCDSPFAAPQQVSLFFLLVDGSGLAVGTPALYEGIEYDLDGPAAPSLNALRAGDGEVSIAFAPPPDPSLVGFHFYAEPVDPEAGCAPVALQPGVVPDEAFRNSEVNSTLATSADLKGLLNGTTFAVGVAATDGVQNVGPLSNVSCAGPRQLEQSGPAGGCAVTPRRGGAPWGIELLGLLALCGIPRRTGKP